MHTREEIENRIEELTAMNAELADYANGWVGAREIAAMDEIYTAFDYDQEDWFSDIHELEKALEEFDV